MSVAAGEVSPVRACFRSCAALGRLEARTFTKGFEAFALLLIA